MDTNLRPWTLTETIDAFENGDIGPDLIFIAYREHIKHSWPIPLELAECAEMAAEALGADDYDGTIPSSVFSRWIRTIPRLNAAYVKGKKWAEDCEQTAAFNSAP